jgi:hypothetical protein
VKLPFAEPGRYQTFEPDAYAFVKEPTLNVGADGPLVSTFAVAVTAAEVLPTLSLIVNV